MAPELLNSCSGVFFYSVFANMKNVNIIKSVLRDIEKLDESVFCYARMVYNEPKTHCWLQISVSKFEFYMHNEDFKKLCTKWHKVFKNLGVNLIFVCGWVPSEEKLVELSKENNLILNI